MANEKRVYNNFIAGLVEDNPLLIGATTLTSGGLANLQTIGTTNHASITIDPDGIHGDPEIVIVTAHSFPDGTATIARGQEGTIAREHKRDTPWVHTATARDYSEPWIAYSPSWTSSGSPDPAIGNGSISAAYLQRGTSLSIRVNLTIGTTTTLGSGSWQIHLPTNIVAKSGATQTGSTWANVEGTQFHHAVALIGSAISNFNYFQFIGGNVLNYWQSTTPGNWQNGDSFAFNATIEID